MAWIGDGNNVCQSLIVTAAKLGMQVAVASPDEFRPDAEIVASLGDAVELTTDPHTAVKGADVIVTDVWASMGQEEEREQRVTKFAGYQVNAELLEAATPGAHRAALPAGPCG